MSEHKLFFLLSGRTLKRTVFLIVIPLLAICVGLYLYAAGGRYVSTDNAYVKANVIIISPEVSGRVTSVLVADNQPLKPMMFCYSWILLPWRSHSIGPGHRWL